MKWKILRHNGVAFPPAHDARGLTIRIQGKPIKLDALPEEMLMAWAKKKDTPYVLDPVFQKNFLEDLKRELPGDYALADIDFRQLNAIADREKTANLSDAEKKRRAAERKAEREALKTKHGTAQVDDHVVEVGAYLVEPPGILMGRGDHPLRGKWKPRVTAPDVILNLDEAAPVPPGKWKKIVHQHDSLWIASWWDELSKKQKYIWLAETSPLRQERDKEKYIKAQKLENGLARVREKIQAGMREADKARAALERDEKKLRAQRHALDAQILAAAHAGDADGRKKAEEKLARLNEEQTEIEKRGERIQRAETQKRQIATVCYLIDRLAMRVGDEKDEDEADTVGASTLRVEHIRLSQKEITFDFLGKDSVQWVKTITPDAREQSLAQNLQDFMRGKQPGDQIFDRIGSTHVNHFLGEVLEGLTAKVFRTYHATTTVRDYLATQTQFKDAATPFEKEYAAKLANLHAAIQCNHKRTPPKNWAENLEKKAALAKKLRAAKPDLTKFDQQIVRRAASLKKLLEQQKKFAKSGPRAVEQKQVAFTKLKAKQPPKAPKPAAKWKKKIAAAEKAAATARKELAQKTARLAARVEHARAALAFARVAPAKAQRDYAERVEKASQTYELARQTRDYNLGTSLKNYIDPRVYKAWGDYIGYDWRRLYTQVLRRKFAWVEQSRVKWNR